MAWFLQHFHRSKNSTFMNMSDLRVFLLILDDTSFNANPIVIPWQKAFTSKHAGEKKKKGFGRLSHYLPVSCFTLSQSRSNSSHVSAEELFWKKSLRTSWARCDPPPKLVLQGFKWENGWKLWMSNGSSVCCNCNLWNDPAWSYYIQSLQKPDEQNRNPQWAEAGRQHQTLGKSIWDVKLGLGSRVRVKVCLNHPTSNHFHVPSSKPTKLWKITIQITR
jgi:hypothetical protein